MSWIVNNKDLLLIGFSIIFILEFLAFSMQRTALLLSREADIDHRIVYQLLPAWFPLVWVIRGLKWSILIVIALKWSWYVAAAIFALDFILSVILPMPHTLILKGFSKRAVEICKIDSETGTLLLSILSSSASRKQ